MNKSICEVVMPQMGEWIAEGTITRWLVEVGSVVEKDQALFEIATDKVDAEIPSPASGVLSRILYPAGATVPVNTVVAWIEGAAEVDAGQRVAEPVEPSRVGGASELEEHATVDSIRLKRLEKQIEELQEQSRRSRQASKSLIEIGLLLGVGVTLAGFLGQGLVAGAVGVAITIAFFALKRVNS